MIDPTRCLMLVGNDLPASIERRTINMKSIVVLGLTLATQFLSTTGSAEPLEYLGRPVRNIPVSSAVKVGKAVFVSGSRLTGTDDVEPQDLTRRRTILDGPISVRQISVVPGAPHLN